ncbi:class 2 transcription repressor NC2 beta [Ordospora colligata]|uniref:Class 2 transcription repressor NC2 beta n=1 Tax=Ordospora colligata OC4 TaxID=1354746 RepID=A0A0B2UCT4_9MICR|nr:class 2 transcription repressor NC2 beta [Ordospora colligata OC4]KHN68841.1 class 2 transcription repressor NC2 beta [Ordospora colligata OC4]TBU13875.1 class 2 transcription repressor NC2 beta [Ordospora colligata]TBU14064.1 class 2 transcription repressor NC2 beta [Ordospora colligata]TBU17733.1 class 2 transcription repressor NC2 beta [Ordospora colligata]
MNTERPEDENMLPKATVDRMVASMLPKSSIVPKESKEMFQNGCICFLNMLTLEANKVCEEEKKKTMSHEHIYKALKNLGFESYVEECIKEHRNYESYIKQKPSKIDKLKDSGLSMEELHDQQEKLFKIAKIELEKSFEDDPCTDNNDSEGEDDIE